MTSAEIKNFTILAECTEGRYIIATTDDRTLIDYACSVLRWANIKPEMIGTYSLKEIMTPTN